VLLCCSFENIAALEFKAENRDVKAMFSAEGEKVAFGLPTKTHRAIESWLGDLEKNMWSSLKAYVIILPASARVRLHVLMCCMLCWLFARSAMRTGYQVNTQADSKMNVSRADFIKESLAQVVMTIAQILWCIGTQRALTSERPPEALARWYDTQVKQLAELTALVRGSLRDADRKKIVALITTDVHARDVVGTLIKDQVRTVSHFSWQQQLRFYWDKDSSNVHVRQANAEFMYGYEYIGIASRLVITPLTDRCWMTVTGALHLRFGASPAGPAGTGKTESVKDLVRGCALLCSCVSL
jgi:dynein heavy chain